MCSAFERGSTGPLAIMPSADQVPVSCTHSTMRWRKWVVLIAGSTGSALRAVRPFQPSHHAGCPTRFPSRRECDGFLIALLPGHHRPHHPGNLVGERDGSDLGGPTRQQGGKPGSMLGAMDLRIADHGKRAGREQAAQIAIALLADAAKLFFTPTRVLLRYQPNPGREVTPRPESLGVSNARDQSGGQRRTHAGDLVEPLARFVGGIVLMSLDIGLHVGWRHQAHGVSWRLKFARPMMRRSTGLDANEERRQLLKEGQHVPALQLTTKDHLTIRVNTMNLKDRLRDIETDSRNGLHDLAPPNHECPNSTHIDGA